MKYNFTDDDVSAWNQGYQAGRHEGEEYPASEGSTNVEDLRNFIKNRKKLNDPFKNTLFDHGYLNGYIIGRKRMQDKNIDTTSQGNYKIEELSLDDIRDLMEMKMEKKHGNKLEDEDIGEDIGEDIDTVTGLTWSDEERKFVEEEQRKQEEEHKQGKKRKQEEQLNSNFKTPGSKSTGNSKRKRGGSKSKRKKNGSKSKRSRKSKKSKK